MEEVLQSIKPRAILAAAQLFGTSDDAFACGMEELKGLAEACNLEPVAQVTQKLNNADIATLIGSGKVQEIKEMVYAHDAQTVVFNNALTPSQLANLANQLECEVLDRTGLILQIFSERARTREAKMQVEYARLQYMMPRLVGLRANLSRQGGTGGSMSNRGAGEKKIELDRRHIEKEMAALRRNLKELEQTRLTQRQKRAGSGMPRIALVGYTNAGKSTLMNAMIDRYCPDEEKKVMVRDMLFATLDTTVRKITPDGHREFLLSDTVGFINDLPTNLVQAFHSTLEEALEADLILEVIDSTDPDRDMHQQVTEKTLADLGAGHLPLIRVMNKADGRYPKEDLPVIHTDKIFISAREGLGLDELLKMIDDKLEAQSITCTMLIPYTQAQAEHVLRSAARVISTEYTGEGIRMEVVVSNELCSRYKDFVVWE
ncbi:MAG: GTPase HflX [Lachnospiraceae bacterium]|nr:GTPase HflX [Lachnospiraceae bacterium]